MTANTFMTTVVREGPAAFLPLPFDPKDIFGRFRAPVVVTVAGYSYRSTVAIMGGKACVPLRKSHREAAGLEGGEDIEVTLTLDREPREVEVPEDVRAFLESHPDAAGRWASLSYTNQKELLISIESAKRPQTRERRLHRLIELLSLVLTPTRRKRRT